MIWGLISGVGFGVSEGITYSHDSYNGLMGGQISEVSATTREIVIESANFTGPRIRRMSVKLGLRSEASTRDEKNLPPALTDLGGGATFFDNLVEVAVYETASET